MDIKMFPMRVPAVLLTAIGLVFAVTVPARAAWYDSCYSTRTYTDWKARLYPCYAESQPAARNRFSRLTKAQEYYQNKEYAKVLPFLDHIIIYHSREARDLQQALSARTWGAAEEGFGYNDLNAVGTALVMKGLTYMELGDMDRAEEALNKQIRHFPQAQCWNPQGRSVNLTAPARDLLAEIRRWRE